MQAVWEPKADGLESLDAVFKADPLDFFVSLSSMTSLIPSLARGASDYAAANAFVDFFAAYQRAQNPASRHRTIIWSDWNQTGAVTRVSPEKAAAIASTFDRLGMRTFSNREGCALFETAMACAAGDGVAIGYIDRNRFDSLSPRLLLANPESDTHQEEAPTRPAPDLKAVAGESILQHLERWEADRHAGRKVPVQTIMAVMGLDEIKRLDPSLIHRIHRLLFAGAEPKSAPGDVVDCAGVITTTVMEVLKLKSLNPSKPFQDYGLDSISAMVLATRLEKKLKRELPPQWLIEFPTVDALSRHLSAQDESRHLTA
jgi:acyl carrier protein